MKMPHQFSHCPQSVLSVVTNNSNKNIYLLDISANAIERAKKRLGDKASKVNWIVSNSADFKPTVKFDFWHDRASFHFLTTEEQISRYVTIVFENINPNGHMVIGTFSEEGPKKCSALDITQYSEVSMPDRFKGAFNIVKCFKHDHKTPFDTAQNFLFCIFRRK